MKRFWEQLKPTERRWVAGIGLVFFILLNWIFVKPHFSDWGKANLRIRKSEDLMVTYRAEIKNRPIYERKIREYQSDNSSDVKAEDQAIDLVRFYNSRANSNNVQVINNSRPTTRTNDPFFVDQEMQLSVQAREPQMVNFLYSLGAGDSIVRVRGMSLRPDGSHQQVNANISIVASYAKKPAVRTGAAAPKSEVPAPSRPPAAQTNKPLVTVSHSHDATNQPVPLTAKRP